MLSRSHWEQNPAWCCSKSLLPSHSFSNFATISAMPASRMVSLFSPVDKQENDLSTKKKTTTVGPCQFELCYFEFLVILNSKSFLLDFSFSHLLSFFQTPTVWNYFSFPRGFQIAGFNCIWHLPGECSCISELEIILSSTYWQCTLGGHNACY